MTSLDQSIANLQTQAGLLLDLPQQLADVAVEQIGNISTAYLNTIDQMKVTKYVNQITGDDDGEGSVADPYKTVKRAVEDTPRGGLLWCYVDGDYHMDEQVNVDGIMLYLFQKNTSVRHNLTFLREVYGSSGTSRRLHGFTLQDGGAIRLKGWTIVMPPLDGDWSSKSYVSGSGIFNAFSSTRQVYRLIAINSCDFDVPASPFSKVITGSDPIALYVTSLTAIDQPMNGNWIDQATDSAGTDPTTIARISTNLATV